jgi:DNA helicase-2/ATP-dependent DNA helicase PcrA
MTTAVRRSPQTGNIYKAYTEYCRKQGVMDFDDILMNMAWLLTSDKQALMSISDRFKYIMVDEFQDTNLAQSYILDKMSLFHKNICVVGDDSQSIYAFRGARIENILNFSKKYPDRKLFRLEQNYRSTKTIVNAANSVISRNESRIPKTCFAVGDQGEKIEILKCYTEQEEALRIASAIVDRMQSDHAQYQDFAILYRTNAQSRALEEQLRKRNLPYVIFGQFILREGRGEGYDGLSEAFCQSQRRRVFQESGKYACPWHR